MIFDNNWHTKFGKHSNIPDCCINHWIYLKNNKIKQEREKNIRYIRCPKCKENNIIIKIHKCNQNCIFTKQLLNYWKNHKEFKNMKRNLSNYANAN